MPSSRVLLPLGAAAVVFLAACPHYFVRPTPVKVSLQADADVRPPGTLPTGGFEGYLRMRVTTNFNGLHSSWADHEASTHFKKLLVTLELNGNEIPVATLDITRSSAANVTVVDKDIGRLAHVLFDSDGGSGLAADGTFKLHIRAVPETLADTAVNLTATADRLLANMPPGSNFALTFVASPAAPLIKALLGDIQKEAGQYANKVWHTSVEYSLRSGLLTRYNAWVLVPEEQIAENDGGVTIIKNDVALPAQFVACAANASLDGVRSSLCHTSSDGRLAVYEAYAWMTVELELLGQPAADVLPTVACNSIQTSSDAEFDKIIDSLNRAAVSAIHRSELDFYTSQLTNVRRIMHTNGAPRAAAYVALYGKHRLNRADGGTWASLVESHRLVSECLKIFEAGNADAVVMQAVAKTIENTLHNLQTSKDFSAMEIYKAVDSLRFALANLSDTGDFSSLFRDAELLEGALYKAAFEPHEDDAAALERLVKQYRRCVSCREMAEQRLKILPKPSPPPAPVTAAAGIEDVLKGMVNVTPLTTYRTTEAKLEQAIDTAAPPATVKKLIKLNIDARRDAEALLKSLNVDEPSQFLDAH